MGKGRPNTGGRKKPHVVSLRVDDETLEFIQNHGGPQKVLGRLLDAVVEIQADDTS